VTAYRLVAEPQTDLDIEAAVEWFRLEFLVELRATYNRIVENPFKYQHLRSGIRRALLHRFPHAVTSPSRATRSSWLQSCTQLAIP
jgi:hypothetical protein